MELTARVSTHFRDAIALHEQAMDALAEPTATAIDAMFFAIANDGKILTCGEGVSAANAERMVAHLIGRFERERMPLAAMALNGDAVLLTAVSDELGPEGVFARQIQALGQAGDILVVFATGGEAPAILQAIVAAHDRELRVIALTGGETGDIASLLNEQDIHLSVPHDRIARIQEIHLLVLHALCDGIDAQLLGDL